jgi:hypothetical protein
MSRNYSLHTVVRQANNALLIEMFDSFQVDHSSLDWSEIGNREVDSFFTFLGGLENRKNERIKIILQDVHDLANTDGMRSLGEAARQLDDVGWKSGFQNGWTSYSIALYTWLRHREIFDRAINYNRSAGISWLNQRVDLEDVVLDYDEDAKRRIERDIEGLFSEYESRGSRCTLEHFEQSGIHYFIAHPDDYPKHILSHNDQKELEEEVINDTFEILFAYNSKIGASLLRAPGSAEIKMQLESTFLFNLFGIIWRPAEKPLFNLGALLDPNFVMPTDPEDMVEVSVLSALLDWPTDKVLLMIKDNTSLVPAVQRRIVQSAIDGPPHVLEIKFCFTFTDPVNGRKRTATFIVKEKEAIVFNTRDEKRLEIIFKVLRNSGIGQNEYAANFLRSF